MRAETGVLVETGTPDLIASICMLPKGPEGTALSGVIVGLHRDSGLVPMSLHCSASLKNLEMQLEPGGTMFD